MSAILGVFYTEPRPVDDGLVTRMVERMRGRGTDRSAVWSGGGAAVAVARNAWELEDGFSGDVLVVDEGDLVIAADASIYYRKDLQDKLAAKDVRLGDSTPSHLILAAYRAWGEQCVQHLEGDYAFVLWDREKRRVFCARDFAGKRPLYYTELGDTLIIASTMASLLTHPDCPDDLNRMHLAETAAGLWPSAHETAYRAISLVPAGWMLSRRRGSPARLTQHWYPPEIEPRGAPSFEDAAAELRELLCRAVAERLAPSGTSAVWMSGGCDSTSVFGAGKKTIQDGRTSQRLRPVSISYPLGDPGREDELITAIGGHWNTPVHWLNIKDIPLFDRPAEGAAARDEPLAHPFEIWNRALARGSRAVGARVALDGNGGDQLFQTSYAYLADLFRAGRWIALVREWQVNNGRGFRNFFRSAIQPTLPGFLLHLAALLRRGRPLQHHLERPMPPWLDTRLLAILAERQRARRPPRQGRTCSAHEMHFFLSCAFFPRNFACLGALALEEGVELRSPLYDQRVIRLAATRPSWERRSGGEMKRLLRRSMHGLLPEQVLAPRAVHTGTTTRYFSDSMRRGYPDLLRSMAGPWTLAELELIQTDSLTTSCQEYSRWPDVNLGFALLWTLHAELWLRERHRPSAGTAGYLTQAAPLPTGMLAPTPV